MDRTRQYSPTISGIRPDHVARYQFAGSQIPNGAKVLDAACGCGYGSWIMQEAGKVVTGVDIEPEAIEYAQRHYKGPTYLCQKAEETGGYWDWIVSFETIEHLSRPELVFATSQASHLIASVPNEERYPWSKERFAGDKYPHLRHYTPAEFEAFIESVGFAVKEWFCQTDKQGVIKPGWDGMFMLVVAERI